MEAKIRKFLEKHGDKFIGEMDKSLKDFIMGLVKEETEKLRKELDRVNSVCDRMEREMERERERNFNRDW
jgi:hypothetical protein